MGAEPVIPDHETIRELVRLPSLVPAPVPAYDPDEPRLVGALDCNAGKNLVHLRTGFAGSGVAHGWQRYQGGSQVMVWRCSPTRDRSPSAATTEHCSVR